MELNSVEEMVTPVANNTHLMKMVVVAEQDTSEAKVDAQTQEAEVADRVTVIGNI